MTCEVCKDPIKYIFYSDLNAAGNTVIYCEGCYCKTILDNFEDEPKDCECGTKADRGQNHSNWCQMFKKEF